MRAFADSEIRCKQCILPKSFPGISLNKNGVCNFCSSYINKIPLGKNKLLAALSKSANKKTPFDCVVQLSGGKDSTYVLYYTVKILGLKAVAANYDSGFQSELAINNMKRACKILDVPLVIHKADFRKRVNILKSLVKIGNILDKPISLCANCKNGISAASMFAARLYGAPTILSGQTDFERFPHNPVTGTKYLIKKLIKGNWFELLPHLIQCRILIAAERTQLNISTWQKNLYSLEIPKVKTVYLFDFIPWACMDPDIVGLLTNEVGWEYPGERVDRFDCVLHPFLCYKWFSETGISWDGYLYSESIRMGSMQREEALQRETIIVKNLKDHCFKLLKRPEFNGTTLDWL